MSASGLGVDPGHCERLLCGVDPESNRFAPILSISNQTMNITLPRVIPVFSESIRDGASNIKSGSDTRPLYEPIQMGVRTGTSLGPPRSQRSYASPF